MGAFCLWTVVVLAGSAWGQAGHNRTVLLSVIAPTDPHHEQSLVKIMPAIMLAVRRVHDSRLLGNVSLAVLHQDSHCSSTYGPLAAFQFYTQHKSGFTSLAVQGSHTHH